MATTIDKIAKFGRKTLLEAVPLYDPTQEINFNMQMALNALTSTQSFEEIASYGGLALPAQTDEYGNPPQTDYEQVNTAQFNWIKDMLQFRVSREAFNDDQYGVCKGYGIDMAAVFHTKDEIDAAAQFMNNVDQSVAPWITPDGLPYASASHTVDPAYTAGGTTTNIISPAVTIGTPSLMKAKQLLKKQLAHKGYLMPVVGPMVLEVSAENELYGAQVLQSTQIAETNQNAKNVLTGITLIGNPYFTNPERWCLRSASGRKCKRFKLTREDFQLLSWRYDDDTDSFKATAAKRKIFSKMDWRGTIYSLA